ncbi:unnamed protein product [Merluccius merluccius]
MSAPGFFGSESPRPAAPPPPAAGGAAGRGEQQEEEEEEERVGSLRTPADGEGDVRHRNLPETAGAVFHRCVAWRRSPSQGGFPSDRRRRDELS